MERKEFLKKLCLSGACLCGFGSVSLLANNENEPVQDNKNQLSKEWLADLLSNLDQDIESETLRKIIKKSSILHYNQLKMDEMLHEYVGDLDKFRQFLENKWGWKIDYNKVTNVLIADENKSYCVCPVLEYKKGIKSSAICYCSEGFAEKMFSTVVGCPVTAEVISSVRRGDQTCKYKIQF
jgi:hypothetical protein